jgi:hypothetical protein
VIYYRHEFTNRLLIIEKNGLVNRHQSVLQCIRVFVAVKNSFPSPKFDLSFHQVSSPERDNRSLLPTTNIIKRKYLFGRRAGDEDWPN